MEFDNSEIAPDRRQRLEVPWGHVSPLTIIWAIERDRFKDSKRSFFAVLEKQ